ncbi:DUF58 domain-containing protein [soil metagenome]
METKELLKKVRKIEIRSKGLSNHLFSGEYHTAFKGRGMSFSEVREYQFGDDVRTIDWNVTARLNHPYVKVFEEERELTVMLMVDISQSALFGTNARFKRDLITEVSAILSFSAINNNDKVGVIFFSNKVEKFIPPKKGRSHILRIIRELIELEPSASGTNLADALRYLNNVMKKKAIVFVLSDFIDRGYEDALSIARRRHDVAGIHVYDPWEKELPPIGLVRVFDPETKEMRWEDFSNRRTRTQYAKWFEDNRLYMRSTFLRAGADVVSIATNEDHILPLLKFFRKRG